MIPPPLPKSSANTHTKSGWRGQGEHLNSKECNFFSLIKMKAIQNITLEDARLILLQGNARWSFKSNFHEICRKLCHIKIFCTGILTFNIGFFNTFSNSIGIISTQIILNLANKQLAYFDWNVGLLQHIFVASGTERHNARAPFNKFDYLQFFFSSHVWYIFERNISN